MRPQSEHRLRRFLPLLVTLLVLGSFIFGLSVGRYRVFPYQLLKESKVRLASLWQSDVGDRPRLLITSLVPFQKSVYEDFGELRLAWGGGGLARVASSVIGVDSRGLFYEYHGDGRVSALPITLDTNRSEYQAFLETLGAAGGNPSVAERNFRILDLEAIEDQERVTIIVSYDFWDPARIGKVARVARLTLDGGLEPLRVAPNVELKGWEVIYEATPFIPFSAEPLSPFQSLHSGGRIVSDGSNILVGLGDRQFDGNRYPDGPQSDTSSFGKVIRIDLTTLKSDVFSNGHRNPQGLLIDREGNIWETEHGPQGGDELNLLREGANYGWPLETYGTDHFRYVWPQSRSQGRHDQYEKPAFAWVPSIAVSNVIQVEGAPRAWDGDLLVSSLKAMSVFRVRIEDRQVRFVEPISIGERIRDLIQLADGTILLWTDKAHFVELKVDQEQLQRGQVQPILLTENEKAIGLDRIIESCQQCHRFQSEASDAGSISLWGVFGREIAATRFEGYSRGLLAKEGRWTEESLRSFLSDPEGFSPGSGMPDPGISDSATIESLVAYLERLR
ncbi:MAG TPA: PQQ-dependent sugar dehydrogenase [Rhodothermales bacterium]|nr:PQQ-dependent sugar dehydrogenase [Rhodothermales bacterium]